MAGLAQNLSFILLGEDRTATKTMTGAAATAEKVTGRIGSAFGKLGGIVGGEFGSILDQVGSGIDNLGAKGAKLSTTLEVGGAVATAAGIGLMQLGSGEKQATDQLAAAIKSAGQSYSDYATDIDKAVSSGEKYGHDAQDTKAALQTMTIATGDTGLALKNMSVVTDLAAAKHISLSDAASLVAKVLNGSGGRTLKQYGITMATVADPTKTLATAQNDVARKTQTLADAQEKLRLVQETLAGKTSLTTAEHVKLEAAEYKVSTASGQLKDSQGRLTTAQNGSKTAADAGKEALSELSAKLSGQASASVDNFGGKVNAVKTEVEDWVKEIAGPAGAILTGLGPVLSVAGVAVDLFKSKQNAATLAQIAANTATAESVAPTVAETGAMGALDAVMDASPIGAVAAAIGVLALVTGGEAIANQENLTQAVESYTSALKEDSNALGVNTRETAANNLLKDGALAAAAKLGISGQLVVNATLGEKGARAELNKELDAQSDKLHTLLRATADGSTADGLTHTQVVGLISAYDKLSGGYDGQSKSLKTAIKNQNTYNAALNGGSLSAAQEKTRLDQLLASIKAASKASPGGYEYVGSTLVPVPVPKKHAAGGIFTKTTQIGSDVFGESGSEAVIPLNSGRVGMAGLGGGGGLNVTIQVMGSVLGDDSKFQKSISDGLIKGLLKGGISAVEIKRALGVAS